MKFLDLCAGIGGFSLGLEWAGMTCAGQVEIDPFCTRVLEKHWPHVPRWKDLKDERIYGELPAVDLVCGGYPCQPFSTAGKRRGAEDDRHLWPYVFTIVQRLRPAWCLFENVAGHVTLGLDEVLSDLEDEGYAARPLVVPACGVDTPHIRKRVWILANAEHSKRRQGESARHDANREADERQEAAGGAGASGADDREGILADANCSWKLQPEGHEREQWGWIGDSGCKSGDIPSNANSEGCRSGPTDERREARGIIGGNGAGMDSNSDSTGCEKFNSPAIATESRFGARLLDSGGAVWPVEPNVGRVAYGVPRRVDRLKGLGNAVVPQVVEAIGLAILAAHYGENQ